MTTPDLLAAMTAGSPLPEVPLAQRSRVLAGLLRPFARRPHVFVADEDAGTRVVIHKTSELDIELVIATAERHWSASVRDIASGAELARLATDYREAAEHGDALRTTMLGDLHAFLAAVVDPHVRIAPHGRHVEVATAAGWRSLTRFA